jgi:hypothetical protein
MKTALHRVAALSPEAFASLARGPFPCVPRYGREMMLFSHQGLLPSVRRVCALLRDVTLQALEFFDKFTLVLLPKGAFYFGTRKHDSIVKGATSLFSHTERKTERGRASLRLAVNKERRSHPRLKRAGLSRAGYCKRSTGVTLSK